MHENFVHLLIGAFRRGNKPPVLLGEDKKLSHEKSLPLSGEVDRL